MAPLVRCASLSAEHRSHRSAGILFFFFVALTLLSLVPPAHALSPDRALTQLRHDRWTPDDGAPAQIMSIAQTPDGFLWLGSRQGLYRFDGLRFERITTIAGKTLVDDDVLSLMAEKDGSLWVGYLNGGMSRIGGKRPANYEYERDDVPQGSLIGFARDASGRLWAATPKTVVWLDPTADTWKTSEAMGFDPNWTPDRIYTDRNGALWVGFSQGESFGIAHLAPGAARFTTVARPVQTAYLDEAPDGTLWAADYWGVRPLSQASPDSRHPRASTTWLPPDFKSGGMLFDHDGAMWLVTVGGLARVRYPTQLKAPSKGSLPPEPEYFGIAQGLSSEVVWTIFEDREGNIWASTGNGLDRFRDNALVPVRLPRRDHPFSMAVGESGRIYVGNPDHLGPMRISPDAGRPGGAAIEELGPLDLEGVVALHRDYTGAVWVGGGAGGLYRLGVSGPERVPLPKEFEGQGQIVTISSDRKGGIWLSKVGAGLLRLHEGKWEDQNAKYEMAVGMSPRTLIEDAQGRIWSDAGLSIRVFENGQRRDFKTDGPGIARISVLQVHGKELWAGGMQGVAARINEKFHQLHGVGGERFERTSGMVILPDGEIWFSGRPGVTRVSAAEMKRWRADPSYLVAFERFGVVDGLRGAAEQTGGTLTALADDQGRLWFSTNRGVHWIDPKKIARNPATEPLAPSLLALKVDERPLTLGAHVQLPVGNRDLRIDYTAPSLRVPERVRFRYRLDGLDTQWQEAGDRRQVLYSRLAPGTYRFRLIASDDAGRWSSKEAAFNLTVPAAFWQTRWFVIACLLLGAGLVWLLVRWRVSIVRTRMHTLYRARVEERERIARDLHDTLLQSVQALVLRVETARGRLARGEGDEAQAGLARALEEAEAGLVEGRERIHDLRVAEGSSEDLESALRQLPAMLEIPAGVEYSVRSQGRSRRWRNPERDEVYWIAREAVSNAIRHAGASAVVVKVSYGFLRSTIEVEDNGCGIEPGVAAHGGGEGHWGLIGMRERTALCGGHLSVESLAKGGTCVRLHIPRWRFIRAS